MGSFKTIVKELRKRVIVREGPSHCRTQDSKVLVCTLHFYYTLRMVSQMSKVVATCIYVIHTYCCQAAQSLLLYAAVRFFIIKLNRCTNFPNLLRHESLIVSGNTLGRTRMELRSILVLLESSLQNCMTYTSAECTVNKLLMTGKELPETSRVSCRSKFGKLVHLVGFTIKKFVTMHFHMNVKKARHYVSLLLFFIINKTNKLLSKITYPCYTLCINFCRTGRLRNW